MAASNFTAVFREARDMLPGEPITVDGPSSSFQGTFVLVVVGFEAIVTAYLDGQNGSISAVLTQKLEVPRTSLIIDAPKYLSQTGLQEAVDDWWYRTHPKPADAPPVVKGKP